MERPGGSGVLRALERHLPARRSWQAQTAAAAVVVAAGVLKPALDTVAGQALPPFITFYPAVVLASLVGGPRTGLAAALLSLLLAWWFWFPPFGSFALATLGAAVTVATFAVTGTLIGLTVGNARRLLDEKVTEANERVRFAQETVHRIKNLIAVVQAIAFKISRQSESQEDFRRDFAARMSALGISQDMLIRADWHDAAAGDMVSAALAPFLPNPALKIEGGPALSVPAAHVGGLCLALSELATNSMKHGALFARPGQVRISWGTDGEASHLAWDERIEGDEQPSPRVTSGFGSTLIQTALSQAAGTSVHYEIAGGAVSARFEWTAPGHSR